MIDLRRLIDRYRAIPIGHKLAAAFVAGALAGWLLGPSADALQPCGDIFIGLLRLLVLPIVVTTIFTGLSSARVQWGGEFGGAVVVAYLLTALAAAATGVVSALVLQPGLGSPSVQAGSSPASPPGVPAPELIRILMAAVTNYALLPVMFGAIAIALTIATLRSQWPAHRQVAIDRVVATADRIVRIALAIVMEYAPIGTFALIAVTFAHRSAGTAGDLLELFAAVYAGQGVVVCEMLVILALAHIPVWNFLVRVKTPLMTALATGSSAATLPVELETAGTELRLDPSLFGFSVPLGVVINKTGTAVYLAAAAVFACHAVGHVVSLAWMVAISVAALIASIATPPISGGSYVVMTGMLQELGLPVGVAGVVAAIPFIGKLNTPVNSFGRLVVTCVVARRQESSAKRKMTRVVQHTGIRPDRPGRRSVSERRR